MFNLNSVYKEMYGSILHYISSRIQSREDAEELAQDVFIKADKNKGSYDADKSQVNTWVFNIAKNTLIDYYRKAKMQTVSIYSEGGAEDDGYDNIDFRVVGDISNDRTPHVELVRKELSSKMLSTFRKLPKKNKRVVNLYYNHQKKLEEIVRMTGENLNTVKTKIRLARELFKAEHK